MDYKKMASVQLPKIPETIFWPVNVKAVFYMETKRRVDLTNLLEGLDDMLVDCKFIEDDYCGYIVSHDGSRVYHDKENPRVEVLIEPSDEVPW